MHPSWDLLQKFPQENENVCTHKGLHTNIHSSLIVKPKNSQADSQQESGHTVVYDTVGDYSTVRETNYSCTPHG